MAGAWAGARRRAALPVALSVGLLVAGCTSSSPQRATTTSAARPATTVTVAPATPAAIRRALGAAVAWATPRLATTDPYSLVLYDYAYRRFGVTELRAARLYAVAATAQAIEANEPELRLIRPRARVPVDTFTKAPANRLAGLVPRALACDEPGSPADFEAELRWAIGEGGYALTHAVLALGIEAELGCPSTGGAALRREALARLKREVARATTVDDLYVERLAMLDYLGQPVPRAAFDRFVASQRPDGSFPGATDSRRHLGALAIWLLARAAGRPDARTGMVLRD